MWSPGPTFALPFDGVSDSPVWVGVGGGCWSGSSRRWASYTLASGLPDGGYGEHVPRELIHRRTRTAFREHMVDYVLGAIKDMFENEGIACSPIEPNTSGARRSLVERYYATVNWTDPSDVNKVLRVYEAVLAPYPEGDPVGLIGYLIRDGYAVDDKGRIRNSLAINLATMPVHLLSDASSIYEHMDRIGECTEIDPAQAISGAKSLIEATTKLVLRELGEPYDEKADVPALVKQVQVALKLHPDTLAPTAKGVETVRRILSNLSQVAVGVAELRNEYGPDHGRTSTVALSPRHAHLAVGCASTYCRMLLETLDARRNPPGARQVS